MRPPDDSASDPNAVTQITPGSGRPASGSLGAELGGYRIEQALGAGGNAIVYRATDARLNRAVALKVLHAQATAESRERFLREVRMIAGLRHPNIVFLYGAGEERGYAWAAMELLPGSLAHELGQGRMPVRTAVAAARDACLGLEAAWRQGIVHRDVKPSNLLRDANGSVKIADFGLAKDMSAELQLTAADVILGTPLYLSPEQAAGRASGCAADLYSLGATLYHLVAGHPPFQSTSALDVIVRHAIEPPPPLPPDVPAPVARLIAQLLEKDPARRPPDYASAIGALDRCLEGAAADAEPTDMRPVDEGRGDGLSASLLAAARGALELGRPKRAHALLEPVVRERGGGWVQAAFLLANTLEESGELKGARDLLEAVAAEARIEDDRVLALWSLGRLAERESSAALSRAVDTYRRITGMSTSRFPKTLLDARIDRLRRQIAARAAGPAD